MCGMSSGDQGHGAQAEVAALGGVVEDPDDVAALFNCSSGLVDPDLLSRTSCPRSKPAFDNQIEPYAAGQRHAVNPTATDVL